MLCLFDTEIEPAATSTVNGRNNNSVLILYDYNLSTIRYAANS